MRYGSVCSGIEAATCAWEPLGWKAAFFSEVDKAACATLAYHYPAVPNLGDMTKFKGWPDANIDVLVGGTPCQSFSLAGLRKGLADPRGNLTLTYIAIAARYRPRWLVWENVPGVLSDDKGRTFGTFLGGLAKLGYGFAYRIYDAQYFGLAQRRKRVFVVGYLGDWRRAAAVLLEPEGLRGDFAPSRSPGQGFAADVVPSLTGSGRGMPRPGETRGQDPVIATHAIAGTMSARTTGGGFPGSDESADGYDIPVSVIPILEAGASTGASTNDSRAGLGVGEPGDPMFTLQAGKQHAIGFSCKDHGADASSDLAPTMRAMSHAESHANAGGQLAVAVALRGRDGGATAELGDEVAGAQRASGGGGDKAHVLAFGRNNTSGPIDTSHALNAHAGPHGRLDFESETFIAHSLRGDGFDASEDGTGRGTPRAECEGLVRRVTPKECERLQGFSDGYTRIPVKVLQTKPRTFHFKKYPDLYDQNPDGTWTKFTADGPRYKQIGNSMAVPVMTRIGRKIAEVDALTR